MDKNTKVYYSIHETSFGKIFIAATDTGLCAVNFIKGDFDHSINWLNKYFDTDNIVENKDCNKVVATQLEEYFTGKRRDFDVKLQILGTEFQKQVWDVLLSIPYGETWTYKDVASKLGDSKKCRAAGGAIGKNPVAVIIPCHRVVGSNGHLTGFSAPGGIVLKKQLLDLEGYKG